VGATEICKDLGWDDPGAPEALADRWIQELDAHSVNRAVVIASVPDDERSVAVAVDRHPKRLIGMCMLDPSTDDAVSRAEYAVNVLGLRGICLFPAMHGVALSEPRTRAIVNAAAAHPGTVVFVHCGVLSMGVRTKLDLPNRFDLRLGQPLDLQPLALEFPSVPFLIPHFGAGLLRETLMLADVCPNIYLDTSSSNRWITYTPGLTLADVFSTVLATIGAKRLLFGTDSSFFPRGWQHTILDQQRHALDTAGVESNDQAAIMGDNFTRLFDAN
jgi:hypothetical protein